MRRLVSLLFLLAVGLAGDADPLEILLKELGSDDPNVREAATRKLVDACDARGEDEAMRWLDSAAMVPDPEVRKRVATIRRELELRGKVRTLLGAFKALELPDARKQRFVRFETEARIGHGWLDAKGRVVDLQLRPVQPLRSAPAKFKQYGADALARSRELRAKHGDQPGALESLAFGNVLLSLWTWERGEKRVAIEFLREANRALRRRNTVQPLSMFVRGRVARMLAQRAVRAAIENEPRPRLVQRWEAVRDLKGPGFVANDYLAAYASLIDEDARWNEPSPAMLRAMAPGELAHYWIHRLRDSHAAPPSLGEADDPARHLLALGWDAVPALIERLQDTRPTRGASRDPHRLARYADVAAELVQRITGRSFRSRGRAEDWWRDVERDGLENYLVKNLADSRLRRFAARALLEIDAERHAPRLLALAWREDPRLLAVLADRLADGDRERVARALEFESREGVLTVARVLWERFEDDRGVRRIVEAFAEGGDDHAREDIGEIEFVCASRAPAGIEGIVRFVKRAPPMTRALVLHHAHRAADPAVLDALLHAMGDRVSWAELYGRAGRNCDRAAWSVARMLRLKQFTLSEPVADRDRELDRLAAWVKARRAAFAWDELRR